MLDFSDRTRTCISVLTSAADKMSFLLLTNKLNNLITRLGAKQNLAVNFEWL